MLQRIRKYNITLKLTLNTIKIAWINKQFEKYASIKRHYLSDALI